MKPTRDEAIDKSIKAWEELAERGCGKVLIPALLKYDNWCPLCSYVTGRGRFDQACSACPLPYKGYCRCEDNPKIHYGAWVKAYEKEDEEGKKYHARLFLKQLRRIPREVEK